MTSHIKFNTPTDTSTVQRASGNTVHVYFGKACTGKTTTARAKYPGAYFKLFFESYDGYAGQSEMILDNVGVDKHSINRLLELFDLSSFVTTTQEACVPCLARTFILISPVSPSKWYRTASLNQRQDLQRRINYVHEFDAGQVHTWKGSDYFLSKERSLPMVRTLDEFVRTSDDALTATTIIETSPIIQPKTSNLVVTHTMIADPKLKRLVLEHVLLTRDARSVPDRDALPAWSDDDLINNYFTRRVGDTSDVDMVVEQHGDLSLIDIGHYGVRVRLTSVDRDRYTRQMRANSSFKKFEMLCEATKSLGMTATIYLLDNSTLKQMSLILVDTLTGRMWLFDHVHDNIDQLITQMYDRICEWLYHHNLVAKRVYLTMHFKTIDNIKPSLQPCVPISPSLVDIDIDPQ